MEPRADVRTLRVNRLLTLRGQQESLRRPDVQDRAILTFDLDADLSGVFNWNVKQLFVYISATYKTQTNVRGLACALPRHDRRVRQGVLSNVTPCLAFLAFAGVQRGRHLGPRA